MVTIKPVKGITTKHRRIQPLYLLPSTAELLAQGYRRANFVLHTNRECTFLKGKGMRYRPPHGLAYIECVWDEISRRPGQFIVRDGGTDDRVGHLCRSCQVQVEEDLGWRQ